MSRLSRTIALLLTAATSGGLSAPVPLAAASPLPSLASALRSRRPFVLVVSPGRPDRATLESEAYGDWVAGFEVFQASHPAGVTIITARSADYRRLIAAPRLPSGFGTLFVNGNGRALVHQGMVLDPPLYGCGTKFLLEPPSCKQLPSHAMADVAFQRR